jgi:hypothetical protein
MNSYQADMRGSAEPGMRRGDVARLLLRGNGQPLSRQGAEPARGQRVECDTPEPRGNTGLELAIVEAEFTRVWARCERAMEQIGGRSPAGTTAGRAAR